MAIEIERKFLIKNDDWVHQSTEIKYIKQGYLTKPPEQAIRVRIVDGAKAFLTIKLKGEGISRPEFEYEIPVEDGEEIYKACGENVVHKHRHIIPTDGLKWEIDVFRGRHSGLVLAEIELPSVDAAFQKPAWIAEDVSDNPRYFNQSMAFDRQSL